MLYIPSLSIIIILNIIIIHWSYTQSYFKITLLSDIFKNSPKTLITIKNWITEAIFSGIGIIPKRKAIYEFNDIAIIIIGTIIFFLTIKYSIDKISAKNIYLSCINGKK